MYPTLVPIWIVRDLMLLAVRSKKTREAPIQSWMCYGRTQRRGSFRRWLWRKLIQWPQYEAAVLVTSSKEGWAVTLRTESKGSAKYFRTWVIFPVISSGSGFP